MKGINNIAALILAGGLGTRLRSVVSDRPKVLAPVNGKPFLSYLLDQLIIADFHNVILCTGYKGEMVREAFGSHYKGLNIRYSREPEPLGTGGALRYALPMIEEDTVLVMNGDSFVDIKLADYLSWHFKNEYDSSIVLVKISETDRYGRVEIGENIRVIHFEEKKVCTGPGWINAGIYLIRKEFIEKIQPTQRISLEKEILPALIDKRLYVYPQETGFIDIGIPESLSIANSFF
jgi:NDP-sugar pyrophosphorylase family protein